MNERNPIICYILGAGATLFFALIVIYPIKMFFTDKNGIGGPRTNWPIYPLPLQVFVLLILLFVANHYYSQLNSVFDNKGVHWKTLLSRKNIAWNQVTSLQITNLRGGEKGLRIDSKQGSFKIEFSLVRDPQELMRFVEENTGRRIIGDRGMYKQKSAS